VVERALSNEFTRVISEDEPPATTLVADRD